jgi:hypothetical protein
LNFQNDSAGIAKSGSTLGAGAGIGSKFESELTFPTSDGAWSQIGGTKMSRVPAASYLLKAKLNSKSNHWSLPARHYQNYSPYDEQLRPVDRAEANHSNHEEVELPAVGGFGYSSAGC